MLRQSAKEAESAEGTAEHELAEAANQQITNLQELKRSLGL